jgi:phage shock protein A
VAQAGKQTLFDLYERLDRIEELIEDMDELNITSREDAERLIVKLDDQIEELEAHSDGSDR